MCFVEHVVGSIDSAHGLPNSSRDLIITPANEPPAMYWLHTLETRSECMRPFFARFVMSSTLVAPVQRQAMVVVKEAYAGRTQLGAEGNDESKLQT